MIIGRKSATAVKALLAGLVLLAFGVPRAMAGTEMNDSKDMKGLTPPACNPLDKDWTLEIGSGATFSNVRSGQPNQAYTIVPIDLTASLRLDDIGLDNMAGGIFRGYSEFFFRGEYEQIVRGAGKPLRGIDGRPPLQLCAAGLEDHSLH